MAKVVFEITDDELQEIAQKQGRERELTSDELDFISQELTDFCNNTLFEILSDSMLDSLSSRYLVVQRLRDKVKQFEQERR